MKYCDRNSPIRSKGGGTVLLQSQPLMIATWGLVLATMVLSIITALEYFATEEVRSQFNKSQAKVITLEKQIAELEAK